MQFRVLVRYAVMTLVRESEESTRNDGDGSLGKRHTDSLTHSRNRVRITASGRTGINCPPLAALGCLRIGRLAGNGTHFLISNRLIREASAWSRRSQPQGAM